MVYVSLNKERIESILYHPDVAPGFFGDDAKSIPTGLIFFLSNDILFPCRTDGKTVSVHAAVLPHQRGFAAVRAAKNLVNWFKKMGLRVVCRVSKESKKTNLFTVICGGKKYHTSDRWNYYEAV